MTQPVNPPLITLIADYGPTHDLAFAEVIQRLHAQISPLAQIHPFAVPAFDTVATGFMLAQLAINSHLGASQKFYVNTAPRKDDLTPRHSNSGEGLAYVKLHNDIEIIAVNSGYSLSFIKPAALQIRAINVPRAGSQFRSRDAFANAFAQIAQGDDTALGDDITNTIPPMPQNCVVYTDGYGNLKCSVPAETLESARGQDALLNINNHTQTALMAEGIFGVRDGAFSFAKGSSGWTLPNGEKVEFAEIVKRGGSAADSFGHPNGGTPIAWRTQS